MQGLIGGFANGDPSAIQRRSTSYLLADAAAQFSRDTEAVSQLWTWSAADAMRLTTSGLPFIERGATYQSDSRGFSALQWSVPDGTLTAGYAAGPDGVAAQAARLQLTGGQAGTGTNMGPGPHAAQVWVRSTSGASEQCQGLLGSGGDHDVRQPVVGAAWAQVRFRVLTTASASLVPLDSRVLFAPMVSIAQDMLIDYACAEQGARYPTSPARTRTRGRDVLQWPPAEVPLALRRGRVRWTVEPMWSASELIDGDVRIVGSFGGSSDVLRFRGVGGVVLAEAVVGGVVVVASAALSWTGTFSSPARLSIVTDAAAGTLAVDGVLTSGTPWQWPSTFFRLGGAWGAGDEIDGGCAIPEAA